MKNIVVHTKVKGIAADGQEQVIEIKIGVPYQTHHEDGIEEWACSVSLSLLYKKVNDVHGADSFQALCLASNLVLDLLKGYEEKGGQLPEFAFEAYGFGFATKT